MKLMSLSVRSKGTESLIEVAMSSGLSLPTRIASAFLSTRCHRSCSCVAGRQAVLFLNLS